MQRAARRLGPFLPMFEVVRRMMWGIFKLENAHLHNVFMYKDLEFIPLHFDTPTKKAHARRKTMAEREERAPHEQKMQHAAHEAFAYILAVLLVVLALIAAACWVASRWQQWICMRMRV